MQDDPLKDWKDKQIDIDPDEPVFSDRGIFQRFTDSGNFKLYKQKIDIAYMLNDPIQNLPQRWRLSIKADNDVQSFQSENIDELKKIIILLCNIYVQMKIKILKSNIQEGQKLKLFPIKAELMDELHRKIKIRPL